VATVSSRKGVCHQGGDVRLETSTAKERWQKLRGDKRRQSAGKNDLSPPFSDAHKRRVSAGSEGLREREVTSRKELNVSRGCKLASSPKGRVKPGYSRIHLQNAPLHFRKKKKTWKVQSGLLTCSFCKPSRDKKNISRGGKLTRERRRKEVSKSPKLPLATTAAREKTANKKSLEGSRVRPRVKQNGMLLIIPTGDNRHVCVSAKVRYKQNVRTGL